MYLPCKHIRISIIRYWRMERLAFSRYTRVNLNWNFSASEMLNVIAYVANLHNVATRPKKVMITRYICKSKREREKGSKGRDRES